MHGALDMSAAICLVIVMLVHLTHGQLLFCDANMLDLGKSDGCWLDVSAVFCFVFHHVG